MVSLIENELWDILERVIKYNNQNTNYVIDKNCEWFTDTYSIYNIKEYKDGITLVGIKEAAIVNSINSLNGKLHLINVDMLKYYSSLRTKDHSYSLKNYLDDLKEGYPFNTSG